MKRENYDERLDSFEQLFNQYDQQIIQPVIGEILANFEQNSNKFQASEEAWIKLGKLKIKLSANYGYLVELIKNDHIKSKIHRDKINSFFTKNDNEKDILKSDYIKTLYKYKKILSDIITRVNTLLTFGDNQKAYKYIHFIFAFVHDTAELTQLINKYNLDINDKTTYGSASIHFAAELGNAQGLELLFNQFHVDINAVTNRNMTALHYIAWQGHMKLLAKLLHNPNIGLNAQKINGSTPLHLAICNGWPEVVKMLLVGGANYNINNNDGNNCLYFAAVAGYTDIFKLIMPYFEKELFDIDQTNSNGLTLLQQATYRGSKQIVKYLIENYKADVNFAANGQPPLLIAVFEGYETIVKYLLCHGSRSLIYISYKYADMADENSLSVIALLLATFDNLPDSEERPDHVGDIFFNQYYIIDIIKNWHKFKFSLKKQNDFIVDTKQEIEDGKNNKIIEFNDLKIEYLSSVVCDFVKFVMTREINLLKANIDEINLKKLITYYKTLHSDLFYKVVINEIMSGEILLHDKNISSSEIIKSINKYVLIFLFYQSKFLNNKFEYEGIISSEKKLIYNMSIKNFAPDLYQINADNYCAMQRWKNENFFKIIGVIKNALKLNDHDVITRKSDERTELQVLENSEQKELAKMIWESAGLTILIASHLSLESYFNSLNNRTLTSSDETKSDMTGEVNMSDLIVFI